MKIHYFSSEPWEEEFVRARIQDAEVVFHRESLATLRDLSDPDADVLCTFIESPVGEAEISRFPNLKLIAARSTGFDHIDLAAAKNHGILVANVPSYGENTVAEFTFALLLSLSRRIPEAREHILSGGFSPAGLRGFDLAGKTIGVIGCGHIGMHVIRMANGFGMNVLGFETHPDEARARTAGFTYASLPDLLAASDIVTLHVPYNAHTHHLLNKENIGLMKKGAYLLNTARGAIIETEALIAALESKALAGAGLDVLEEEGDLDDEMKLLSAPHPNAEAIRITLENHYLISHPRVIVTPHLAFNTTEAIERILDTTIKNVVAFSAGSPTNIVTSV
jgi:D-lactate dehydrogenase